MAKKQQKTKLKTIKRKNMENQINPNKKSIFMIAIVSILAIGAVGFVAWQYFEEVSELKEKESKLAYLPEEETISSEKVDETENWKSYRNEEYGFEITLINSWKGYSVLEETWNGVTLDGKDIRFKGPQIVIRHPEWILSQHWQDIPIMVFTNEEWNLVETKNLNVNAAPIGPRKLSQNQNYIFALPPRWVGFTDNLGQDEAKQIAGTFKALFKEF